MLIESLLFVLFYLPLFVLRLFLCLDDVEEFISLTSCLLGKTILFVVELPLSGHIEVLE